MRWRFGCIFTRHLARAQDAYEQMRIFRNGKRNYTIAKIHTFQHVCIAKTLPEVWTTDDHFTVKTYVYGNRVKSYFHFQPEVEFGICKKLLFISHCLLSNQFCVQCRKEHIDLKTFSTSSVTWLECASNQCVSLSIDRLENDGLVVQPISIIGI